MPATDVTPEVWSLPTPFRDQSDGRVTIHMRRPTVRSVAFMVVLVQAADALVVWRGLQHDALSRSLSYAVCVLLAALSGALFRRLPGGDRVALWCIAALGLVGIGVGGVTSFAHFQVSQLVAVALVVLVNLAGEAGYRYVRPIPPPPGAVAPAAAERHALTSVALLHDARGTLLDAFGALDRAIAAGEDVADETVRILKAEVGGISEQAAVYAALLRHVEPAHRAAKEAPAHRRRKSRRPGPLATVPAVPKRRKAKVLAK
jgi:hypothetical protein